MSGELKFRTKDHPEANGRRPLNGDQQWTLNLPLEDGRTLFVSMGKEGRDLLFGMLIAERVELNEGEPN